MFQSRRSLLVWKIFGERLDGCSNDDLPTETKPGSRRPVLQGPGGRPGRRTKRTAADLDLHRQPRCRRRTAVQGGQGRSR